MLSSLLRPKKKWRRVQQRFPSSPPYAEQSTSAKQGREPGEGRYAAADWTETDDNDDETDEEDSNEERLEQGGREYLHTGVEEEEEEEEEEGPEDGDEATPLLPIFSAAHLDTIPVYHVTHAIRLIIVPRCETTLTWDQLRSPQVSQFLVKPMQQQIRTAHFSRATLYALMANCLQFGKEGQMNPANAGNSRTRAMVCELLAIKLLKEYSTRELIDALSYDFFPLQGLNAPESRAGQLLESTKPKSGAARISTLEVAIRAQAKRFLAHPAVIQQLEAIWAGTIVFHSAADQLHRQDPPRQFEHRRYGGTDQRNPRLKSTPDSQQHPPKHGVTHAAHSFTRRTVTLYDPRDASLFKLSRLRVPRYRQFFSTCSLVVLLGLFLAVLAERSTDITTLEVIFWLWSAGFMLDEIVGFNEQGFSLYILSFWNAFDLGILLLLVIFYCMRLCGIFLVDEESHEDWNNMAYDVLGANAVLLCPRIFSVLDNSRYFSQLLIAFRLMAVDLAAVFVLIIISCSGFFVAFTLSFGNNDEDAAGVAYRLFQLLNGYSPAAWDVWPLYNPLGKAILMLFLFVCHFLIVTILITVLTNSFMAIVSNANEEHQFVFAVNTISMVKNDALFSYVAPSNIFAWVLAPLRYIMPFRDFVKMNRYIIKITHWPILFSIFTYEKVILTRRVYEPTDLVENRGLRRRRAISFVDPERVGFFSPSIRVRQESISGYQKDRALDEVFRLAPRDDPRSALKSQEQRQTSNVVNSWMDQHEGIASSPPEQDRSIVDRLERRRQASHRANLLRQDRLRRQISGTRSDGSGPAGRVSPNIRVYNDMQPPRQETDVPSIAINAGVPETEDDGDDELLTNTEDDNLTFDKGSHDERRKAQVEDYFKLPNAIQVSPPRLDSPSKLSPTKSRPSRRPHNRNLSTNTILYNPVPPETAKSSSSTSLQKSRSTKPTASGSATPMAKRPTYTGTRPRPITAERSHFQSIPSRGALFNLDTQLTGHQIRHRRSSLDMGMDVTSDMGLPDATSPFSGALPGSFATQMAMATGMVKGRGANTDSTDRMMGRLMLARMKTLEEGLQEVVREFKEMRTQGNSPADTSEEGRRRREAKRVGKKREKDKEKRRDVERERPRSVTGKETTTMMEGFRDAPEDHIIEAFLNKGSSY